VDDVILVDDFSKDRTVEFARSIPAFTLLRTKGISAMGNQRPYRTALDRGADIAS
jgi:glycosyltransferase involved in cell wall biosynthesis